MSSKRHFPTSGHRAVRSGGDQVAPLGRPKPLLWVLIIFAMVAWSLFSWFAYVVADPVLAWLGSALTGIAENGQSTAETFGGQAAGDALQTLGDSGLIGQLVAILQLVTKPAIVVLWGLGLIVLLVLPKIASAALRLLGSRRH